MKFHRKALTALAFVWAWQGATADVAESLEAGTPFLEVIEEARDGGMTPGEVTQALIDAGQPTPRAAFGVASVWNDCNATLEAVGVAARANEEAVEPLITTLAGLRNCGCSTESAWAKARLDTRLRPDSLVTLPIELSDACTCLTAAVEAAVVTVPAKADRIVQAAVDAATLTTPIMDSVGQRLDDDDRLFESSVGEPVATIYRRKPDACEADTDELDEFDPTEFFEEVPAGNYRDVGLYRNECEEGDFDGLVITEYNAEPGVGNYVELYNGTDETIELGLGQYNLTMYFAGLRDRGHSVPLLGPVAPGRTIVVADASAPEVVLRRTDLVVPQLAFLSGDAMSVHAGFGEDNCQCAEAVVASSLRAPTEEELERDPQQTNMVHHKIERIYGVVPDVVPGQVVDAIGQVDWSDEYSEDAQVLAKMLRRETQACRGDSNELDQFLIERRFLESDEPELTDVGRHESECRTAQSDIVISEFVTYEDEIEAIELHNPLPADIDLADGGYILELYRPGSRTPFQVIDLQGTVEGNGNFLLATSEALEEIDTEADLTVDQLDANESSAVVLKKLSVPTPMRCSNVVASALQTFFIGEFTFVSSPRDPIRRPITPPVVDPPASPN